MSANEKQPTCEELIDASLKDRREWLLPDLDSVLKCKAVLDDIGQDYPDPNPWAMDREEIVDGLEGIGIACFDEETLDELREAYADSMGDLDGLDDWETAAREAREQEIAEGVLSIDTKKVYRVCLSFGGPADYFELDWDGEGWSGGRYLYQDWLDGARREIPGDEAEQIAERFGIYPETELEA